MLQLQDQRKAPITPQLALRVAVMAGIALAMFAIVFFRLWYLQVLSGDKYLTQANDNRVRDIVVPAPRGDVIDRNGTVLIDNRISIAVQIEPQKLPPPGACTSCATPRARSCRSRSAPPPRRPSSSATRSCSSCSASMLP